MCATNKQFYIGASSLFSAIDTSLLDRFNSRTLSSRLNPISYITHLPKTNDQFLHQFLVRFHSFLILPTLPRRHSVLPITTNVHGGRLFEHFLLVKPHNSKGFGTESNRVTLVGQRMRGTGFKKRGRMKNTIP